jgi:phosphate/sulfate permease
MAFGIGANDVANAFASSVAAKSLSLRNAVIAAAIFEFAGALLLGAKVTGTIRGKILISSYYVDSPDILMFGNLCALMVASFGLLVATKYEYPISTTHTIIAALMGFSVAANGFKSVDWWPWGGKIFISWVTSPLLTGILSFMFFSTVKYFVLESADTFRRATNW